MEGIVRARIDVPRKELQKALEVGVASPHQIEMHIIEVIKGDLGRQVIKGEVWSGGEDYRPSPKAILALDGHEVLAFIDELDGDVGRIAQHKDALRRFDPAKAERLRGEVLNQQDILKNFADRPVSKPDEFQDTIKRLIDKLLDEGTRRKAIEELQRLDARYVPSIIRLMDDRRPLRLRRGETLEFINTSPDAFERLAHYAPEVVVDALAHVLTVLTGESFGSTTNGGTEEERRRVVDAWRVYLHYNLAQAKVEHP